MTTDASGQYSDDVTFPIKPPDEDWTAQAFYAGDSAHLSSESPVRSFVVAGNF